MSQFRCCVCSSSIDGVARQGKKIPCRRDHVYCLGCFGRYIASRPGDRTRCWVDADCDPSVRHLPCPKCSQTFHEPEGGPDQIETVPSPSPQNNPNQTSHEHVNGTEHAETASSTGSATLDDAVEDPTAGSNRCPNCDQRFNSSTRIPTLAPCQGIGQPCIVCQQCIKDALLVGADHQVCISSERDQYCDEDLQHFSCPICAKITHLPRGGIETLPTIPISRSHLDERRYELSKQKMELVRHQKELYILISSTIDELNEHHSNCASVRKKASVANLVTGAMIVGGSLLQPHIAVAVAAFGALSGAVGIGATMLEKYIDRGKKQQIERLITETNKMKSDFADMLHLYLLSSRIVETVSRMNAQTNRETASSIVHAAQLGFSAVHAANILRCTWAAENIAQSTWLQRFISGATLSKTLENAEYWTSMSSGLSAVLLPVNAFFVYQQWEGRNKPDPSALAEQMKRVLETVQREDANFLDSAERNIRKANATVNASFTTAEQ